MTKRHVHYIPFTDHDRRLPPTIRVGEREMAARLSYADMPEGVEMLLDEDEQSVTFKYVYPAGSSEAARELTREGVTIGVGLHSQRLLTVKADGTPLFEAARQGDLPTPVLMEWLAGITKEIERLARSVTAAGPRLNYEVAQRGISGAPPAWLIHALESMRGSDRISRP